ncbi:xanthine dehydrogenase family protein molybdopterin-binding subunit [Phenylobacterium sp.]|jgi:isoquinoline 1-oxidoreductase beta subunit|uniref:xanthine dehydrogenase family protein molybdopterin-binding subunit n=1 Tax=Phenylobacterium sp. TaxID=1871053 RepID=UPI002E33DDB2|nr:xanthine dehydrogenase family protein molybdopterin-binding subunit [Phenylobacterium sp.]HEX2560832.1 xanthine dehydrogenase family protein molybdopterin-binding subunit [Phenylobacterium sp.]
MAMPPSTSRRGFLIGATMTGGALLVGCSPADALSAGSNIKPGAFGPFIKIAADGAVTVVNKHIEFGQGSHAGLAAIVAEELGADWDKVRIEQAPANAKLYANPALGLQLTGGSTAIASSWAPLRHAAASARAMFVQAAATKWGVPAGEIAVADGVVSHTASGKSAGFGELMGDAAQVTPPQSPTLKDPKTFTLVGTDRVRRKDAALKATGQARFTQDVRLPNMLVAMVAHPDRFGGTVKSFDAAQARKVPGVVDVFQVPTGVAVVAETTWAAKQGRDALKVVWDDAKAETRGTDQLLAEYRELASGKAPPEGLKWEAFETRGTAPAAGGQVLEATYDFPYLAHAAMEPMNCVAEIGNGKRKLTFGSQAPTLDQLNAAKILAALPGAIEIETVYAGGSFGRRANFSSDYVAECLHVAKKTNGRPVKLVWTREDDMAAGHYRPLVHHRVRVVTDAEGFPVSWTHRIVTQSIMKGSPMPAKGVDQSSVEGVGGSPYLTATPHVDAQVLHADVGVPVLWWRSVGHTHTAYAMEHTIDQLARKAGKDPLEYRRALLTKAGAKRHLAVLDLVAEKSGWTNPLAAGVSRGIAVHESFGSVVAEVAEVQIADGAPKVGRVVAAIDCGTAISPNQVASQVEGGVCYGLSAVLYGQITLKDGKVEQTNFDGYRVLRNSEAPTVETYILPQAAGAPPTGVGEPGTPPIGPAVANAILAATGQPSLSLPMVKA